MYNVRVREYAKTTETFLCACVYSVYSALPSPALCCAVLDWGCERKKYIYLSSRLFLSTNTHTHTQTCLGLARRSWHIPHLSRRERNKSASSTKKSWKHAVLETRRAAGTLRQSLPACHRGWLARIRTDNLAWRPVLPTCRPCRLWKVGIQSTGSRLAYSTARSFALRCRSSALKAASESGAVLIDLQT